MTARTPTLVKDIAALFVKYSLADWVPVIEELEKGGRGAVAAAVRDLAAATPPARAKSKTARKSVKKPGKATGPQPKTSATLEIPPFSEGRAKYLEPLLRALKGRVVAPTAHDMRELYLEIGIKEPYPKRREDAAEAIVRRLDLLSETQIRTVVQKLVGQDEGSDRQSDSYARWFNLILDPKR